MAEYNPNEIETKWQNFWQVNKSFKGKPELKQKFYCLDMFPYPSGAGLHLGHPVGYTATDIYSRYKRMRGFDILHPMGWDAFGLPAEQHAVNTGEHPAEITEKNCARFRQQMDRLGLSYDWDREIYTCRADYYRWTQWIFLKLYNSWFDDQQQKARPIEELPIPEEIKTKGEVAIENYRADRRLAYYADAMVNWCPALGTVLANEEVIDGKSERGSHDVIRKPMKQWMLRITKYTERLLEELEPIDWPESIKEQQRNWIGKKQGAEISFAIHGSNKKITAFTTRPDTLCGVTFMVLSPEHALVPEITTPDQKEAVEKYCLEAQKMSDFLRTMENRKKTGVFSGGQVLNPITKELVPVYIGDYVLSGVGTGAVMGVPAHDQRDFEFARMFNIEIRPVLAPISEDADLIQAVKDGELAWTGTGLMLHCPGDAAKKLSLEGRTNVDAHQRICEWIETQGHGRRVTQYKLRDWIFSRQRYWGEPIPIIHWEDGTSSAVPESELPLILPPVENYKPSEGGESPLARATEWLEVVDPKTGKKGRRETNTMPQWAGSCWYYLRFIDPNNSKEAWDKKLEKDYMPVDLYVGGAEHAVLHLLYSRFWHKLLYDLGYVSTKEPFQKLVNQGLLLSYAFKDQRSALVPVDQVEEGADGLYRKIDTGEVLERIVAKMSKALRNVVTPDEVIDQHGADTLRCYIMFMGPIDCSRIWDAKAVFGIQRFLKRTWSFVTGQQTSAKERVFVSEQEESADLQKAINKLIKKATDDLDNLRFNTAIAAMMEFLNQASNQAVSKKTLEQYVLVLAPFAPHLAEELWQQLGHSSSLTWESWPEYDQSKLKEDQVTVVVQVNGKKRATFEVGLTLTEDELKKLVVERMLKTDYKVTLDDRFIIVCQPGSKIPKLINVMSAS